MVVFEPLKLDTSSDSSDTNAENKALAVNRRRWVPSLLIRLNYSNFSPETPAVNDQRVAYTEGTNNGSPTDMTMIELHGLAKFFPWPNGVKLRLPCNDGGSLANYPGCIVVYEDSIKAGFRLPLHPFISDFLSDTKLCPAQLTPNAWRSILAFLLKFKELNLVPSYEAFERMYNLRVLKSFFYSVVFVGVNLISLPKCADSWDKKWFLVCASDEFQFDFPMYPGKCKANTTKNRRMMERSVVGEVIEMFKKMPRKAGKNVLDASLLEEAGLSLPHPVKEPNLMYAQYITKRKRANARVVVGPSNKKVRIHASLKDFYLESKEMVKEEEEEEEDPEEESEEQNDDDNMEEEEDPEEIESEEMSSVNTLFRRDVLTALKKLPELLLAAQDSQRLKRELSESTREVSELKRERSECRKREMELMEELGSKSEEIEVVREEKKKVEEELREMKSVFMEVTEKARECVEISSSALKPRVSSTD